MNLRSIAQLTVAAALLAVFWTSVGTPEAHAQQKPNSYFVTMTLEQADVTDALKQLFGETNVSYSIAPGLFGAVNVKLAHVPFPDALDIICKQANLSYKVDGGVYVIDSKDPGPAVQVRAEPAPQSFAIPGLGRGPLPSDVAITQDSRYLYVVRGLQVYKLEKSSLRIVEHTVLPPPQGAGFGRRFDLGSGE